MNLQWLRLVVFAVVVSQLIAVAAFAQNLSPGRALNDAWFDPETPGQGFFIMASEEVGLVFIGWMTFPMADEIPFEQQRWLTLRGGIDGPVANLTINLTTDGTFDDPAPVNRVAVGSAVLTFSDCNHGHLEYSFDNGRSGVINIERIVFVEEQFCAALAEPQQLPLEADADQTVAITHVNVLPMTDQADLLLDQTIIVTGGSIESVGPATDLDIPAGAVVLDGRGRYVMPGMVDTHTHLATNVREFLGPAAIASVIESSATDQLILYLARGVTTILNNGDFGEALPRWSNETESGLKVGPTIYSAQYARGNSTTPDGGPANRAVTDAFQARQFTRSARNSGYDMIKIYNWSPREAVLAILDEARLLEMPVIGHFPQTLSTQEVVTNGLSMVAHGGAFIYTMIPDRNINRIPEAVALARDNDLAVTATLGIEEIIAQVWGGNTSGIAEYRGREENRFMHPTTRALNERGINGSRWNPPGASPGGYDVSRDFVREMTRQMQANGVMVLMGTDSPTVLGVPGFSAHHELLALQNAGLSNREVLRIATRNGGEYLSTRLNIQQPFGVVSNGAKADLIMLDANPLDDLAATQSILGVMTAGHWRSTDWFTPMLEAIAETNGN